VLYASLAKIALFVSIKGCFIIKTTLIIKRESFYEALYLLLHMDYTIQSSLFFLIEMMTNLDTPHD